MLLGAVVRIFHGRAEDLGLVLRVRLCDGEAVAAAARVELVSCRDGADAPDGDLAHCAAARGPARGANSHPPDR